MADMEVVVVAKLRAQVGKEDEVKDALTALVEPTRQDPDCMEYLLHQAKEDPRAFVFYEQWTSQEALDRHLGMPYIQSFFARAEELLDGAPEVALFDLII